jgi:NTP pyrophosphatase (non-canonical NTP hydrolase)
MVQRLKASDYEAIAERMTTTPQVIDIDHAITGIFTEGAEMADAFKRYKYYGTELDTVNLKEEIGDLLWYVQLLCASLDTTIEEAMDTNEAKLKARFGESFTEAAAVTRDLETEREILENKSSHEPGLTFLENDDPLATFLSEGRWLTNLGRRPTKEGTLIDFVHEDGTEFFSEPCGYDYSFNWELDMGAGTIVKWRLAVVEQESQWTENTGAAPVAKGTLVDVTHRSGDVFCNQKSEEYSHAHTYFMDGSSSDIVKWRLTKVK